MSTILSLAILGPILAQAQAPAPKADEFTLKCTALPVATRKMRLEGTAPLPDNTMLKFAIYPLVETVYASDRVKIKTAEGSPLSGNKWAVVNGRRFSIETEGAGPAVYRIRIFKQGTAATATGTGPGTWQFELVLWDSKHLDKLGDELRVAEETIKDCKPILEQVRKAIENEKVWAASGKQIEKNVDAQLNKMQKASKIYYPGGLGEAGNTMRILRGTLQAFKFVNGEFKAEDYYGNKNDNRGAKFELPNLIRYIDESQMTVGREFLLWLLKDFKRDGSPENARKIAAEVEKQMKTKHLVVTSYADRFKKLNELKPDELEYLEKQLRGEEP